MTRDNLAFSTLLGKIFVKITKTNHELLFETSNEVFKLFHEQDCCEVVYIEDICGDLNDLIGSEILKAEEATSRNEDLEEVQSSDIRDTSFTWTFYHLATIKGYVTIRWFGTSNGYYSEYVELRQINKGQSDAGL